MNSLALRSHVERFAGALPPPRVIYDRNGESPYLARYYLAGGPTMPDGSWPFDRYGTIRDGAEGDEGGGLYLHRFFRGDDERELHSHPWGWSASFVLWGGYMEERLDEDGVVRIRARLPGQINIIRSTTFHRVELLDREAWTLFVAGPKTGHSWGFWNKHTGAFLHWARFIKELRDPAAFALEKQEQRKRQRRRAFAWAFLNGGRRLRQRRGPERVGEVAKSGRLLIWGGRPMLVSKCEGESRCFACERTGEHIEPYVPARRAS